MSEPLFDLEAVFEVDDYIYFYSEELTDERSDMEIAGWGKLLELDAPVRILDLACGYGRIANRLAALGHSVVGLDILSGFLETGQKDAEARGVQVDYRQGDMRQLNFVEEFDRVLMLFTSFGYFNDDENQQVMTNIAQALRPGGLVGFDIPNRDITTKDLPTCGVVDKGADLMVNRLSLDALTGRLRNERIVIRDGVRKDKPFAIRLYHATEIRDLLNKAGLEVRGIYGGDLQPLSADSRVMFVIARKALQA